MSARRVLAVAVTAAAALAGSAAATGCGSDHGQANALAACHTFASANGGGLASGAFTAKLGEAVRYAGKASKQSAQWDTLQASLSQIAAASTQTPAAGAGRTALSDARKVIDSACQLAARGY